MADASTTRLATNTRFNAAAPPAIANLIGFRLTAFGGGGATVELNTGPQHYNPMGTVHGGVLCDIGDAAMGMAFASTLEADQSFTTL
jgi:acyl-coenzyme A thioesterase PaaI-like protein